MLTGARECDLSRHTGAGGSVAGVVVIAWRSGHEGVPPVRWRKIVGSCFCCVVDVGVRVILLLVVVVRVLERVPEVSLGDIRVSCGNRPAFGVLSGPGEYWIGWWVPRRFELVFH